MMISFRGANRRTGWRGVSSGCVALLEACPFREPPIHRTYADLSFDPRGFDPTRRLLIDISGPVSPWASTTLSHQPDTQRKRVTGVDAQAKAIFQMLDHA